MKTSLVASTSLAYAVGNCSRVISGTGFEGQRFYDMYSQLTLPVFFESYVFNILGNSPNYRSNIVEIALNEA